MSSAHSRKHTKQKRIVSLCWGVAVNKSWFSVGGSSRRKSFLWGAEPPCRNELPTTNEQQGAANHICGIINYPHNKTASLHLKHVRTRCYHAEVRNVKYTRLLMELLPQTQAPDIKFTSNKSWLVCRWNKNAHNSITGLAPLKNQGLILFKTNVGNRCRSGAF